MRITYKHDTFNWDGEWSECAQKDERVIRNETPDDKYMIAVPTYICSECGAYWHPDWKKTRARYKKDRKEA